MPYNPQAKQVLTLLDTVWDNPHNASALHEPNFTVEEAEFVASVIRSGWVSTAGSEIRDFEKQIAKLTATEDCIAVNSGTSALHLAVLSLGLRPGDGVALPSLGFVATANAIAYAGAVPHFIDVDADHGLIDAELLETYLGTEAGSNVKAIVSVCLFGQKNDPLPLINLAKKNNLYVIEDAAGALGTCFEGKPVGSDFDATIFSFNGNKILTTGGGGALICKDPEKLAHARTLANVAKINHNVMPTHSEVGYNYRMPNLNAALGLSQLPKLTQYIELKQKLRLKYRSIASTVDLKIIEDPVGCRSNAWLNNILLSPSEDPASETERLIEIIQACHKNGYGVRPVWEPLHMTRMYNSNPRTTMQVTESLSRRLISLPSSPQS